MVILIRSSVFSLIFLFFVSVQCYGWSYNDLADGGGSVGDNDLMQYLNAGNILPHLPDGARSIIVDEVQYFVANGTWFLPVLKSSIQYIVVLPPA